MHGKKRLISAVFIFAAALVAMASVMQSVAAAKAVFDGKVLAGYRYSTTTGAQFSLASVAPLSKVAIDLPGESLIVEDNLCSTGRMFKVCYNGATFKGYNYSLADREVYEFKITISSVAPEFTVAKTLDKALLEVAESTVVHVNITNAGSAQGTARFSEAVPAQFKIVALPDQACGLSSNNTLLMAVDLKGGEAAHCDYKITALSPGAYPLVSTVSYDAAKTEMARAIAAVAVNAPPFSVVENISNNLLLGDLLDISLLLKPSANLSSFVFNAWFPGSFKVASVNKEAILVKQADGANVVYGDKTTVFNLGSRVNISLKLAYVGTSVIIATSSWVYNGLEQQLIKGVPVNATLARPYLRLTKYDKEAGKLYMDVVNPAHTSIYNIKIIPEAGTAEFSVGEMGSSSHASFSTTSAASQTQAPSGAANLTVSYTGTIVYHTAYGQELSEPFRISVSLPKTTAVAASGTDMSNGTGRSIELPANKSIQNNSSRKEMTSKQEQQPKNLMPVEIKTALIITGIIIVIILIFFAISGRKSDVAEENGPDE